MLNASNTINRRVPEMTKNTPFRLTEKDVRLTTFPIQRPTLYAYYKDAERCFWTTEEINTSKDAHDFETRLTSGEQRFVKHILAFFAASDGIVNLNLTERFKNDVSMLEAGYFYDFQVMMENVHAQMYSILLDTIILDSREKNRLLNAAETMPIIKKMSDYMFKCIQSEEGFASRVLRMACVEGIFFSGCFCEIYRLGSKGLMPALTQSNELIARDEAMHTMFALHLYTLVEKQYKLTEEQVYAIFREAVGIAKEFMADALPDGLMEMNARMMGNYIECQADNLLELIGVPILYGSKHDFGFMEQINMTNRTNFFERHVSEYAKTEEADKSEFDVDMDF